MGKGSYNHLENRSIRSIGETCKMLTISQHLRPSEAASPEESDCSNHIIGAARLHSRAELMIPSFHLILSVALDEAHENIHECKL